MQIALIGSEKAGKTNYLALLTRAEYTTDAARKPMRVTRMNDAAAELMANAADVLVGRHLEPSQRLATYQFDLEFPGIWPGVPWLDLGRETVQVTLLDPPGGHCLPEPGRPPDPNVVDALARADGVLVMLPGERSLVPRDIAKRLSQLIAAVAERKKRRRGPVFDRAVIALSMCELIELKGQPTTIDMIDSSDPYTVVTEVLDEEAVEAVRAAVPDGGDGYALLSAYGFDRTTRRAAATRTGGSDWHLPAGSVERWWPYRLAEPIEFLARGMCWRDEIDG